MNSAIKTITFVALAILLFGCATPANRQAMTLSKFEGNVTLDPNLREAFAVRSVGGGQTTNPLWTSQVGNEDFKGALDQSLEELGYKSIDSSKPPLYFVDADLKELDQPLLGMTFDVMSNVVYTVEGQGIKKTIPISAVGTAKVADAFIAVERLKIANERSIRENLRLFINSLSKELAK